jgi:uncharacterized Tic20 family protein
MPEEYPLTKPTSDDRVLAVLSHILSIVPGIGIFGPLVIYLVKRDQPGFVLENARESLNFQLTMIIFAIISALLVLIAIGIILLWALGILNVILVIIAAIRVSENKIYRYPFNLRLIK